MKEEYPLIMIVDDNITNLDLLVEILESEYRIMVAKDGQKALASIKKCPPDLILLDIQMPIMDGFEVCTQLRADPDFIQTPIIFITGADEKQNQHKMLACGATAWINKPFRAARLRKIIKNYL